MSSTTLETKLRTLIDQAISQKQIHNVVLGVQSKDGRMNFTGAAGFADAENRTPMTPDAPYFIASITKMYTAAVVMRLYEQGRLDVDAPITRYLPDSLLQGIHVYQGTDYSRQINVYQLLNQTSGLADYFEDKPKGGHSLLDNLKQGRDVGFEVEQVVEMLHGLKPHFAPGAKAGGKAHYSDTNFQLLGAIIEAVTGQHLAEAFASLIFEPLGLKNTYFYRHDELHPGQQPAPFYYQDQPVHIPHFMTSSRTDGGLVSTVAESLAFTRAFFDGELFDRRLFERMMARWNMVFFPMIQYGYGLMRFQMPSWLAPFQERPELIGHAGSTNSFAFQWPDRGIYIAGTLNQIDSPRRGFVFMLKVINALK